MPTCITIWLERNYNTGFGSLMKLMSSMGGWMGHGSYTYYGNKSAFGAYYEMTNNIANKSIP